LTIDGNDNFRVLQGSFLDIEGLTIANGRSSNLARGACILADRLSLTDVSLTHCITLSAPSALGGAAFVSGELIMRSASIVGSGAAGASYVKGGAAFVGGTATLY